jgi:adenylate cyclase
MSATLQIKFAGKEVVYTCAKVTTLGRVETNDVTLPDPKISRSHALLRILGDGRYYLIDLGSANGTFVNGKRLVGPSVLNDSDEIRLGDHILIFNFQPESVDICDSDAMAKRTILASSVTVQRATILVMDIRDFTSLSEQVSPSFLAAVVGSWFRAAGEIADKNGGEVDKYTGDGVMIRWMADIRVKDTSVESALITAHEMNLATAAISKDFPDLPAPLKIGTGVNTGQAALGHVGAGMGRDYTALGDAVNLAFRFEEATKSLNQDIVIGPDSYKYLPETFWPTRRKSIVVKGKDKPITVCALSFEELASWVAGV